MESISVETRSREEFKEITGDVQRLLSSSGVRDGVCVITCPHTTAGLTINENADPDVRKDMISFLRKLVPQDPGFAHSEGNSDAHIKASLMGNSLTLHVRDGQLVLGTWQGIYFCEFDGPRQRRVDVAFLD